MESVARCLEHGLFVPVDQLVPERVEDGSVTTVWHCVGPETLHVRVTT